MISAVNRAKLTELRKKYGYDMAMAKQQGYKMDEREELEALLLFELSNNIKEMVNQFYDNSEDCVATVSEAFAVLMSHSGELAAVLDTLPKGDIGVAVGERAFHKKRFAGEKTDDRKS